MEENINNEELAVLDFNKLWRIIWYRKYWSLACYVIIIVSTILFTLQMPKKYTSEATILLNKSQSTNLADINPYILAQFSSSQKGGIASLLSGSGSNDNELAIMKSPIIIDQVIKENNIKYESGPKKGEFKTTKDFFESKQMKINEDKDSNLINIEYLSESPELSYNIVNSFINNYKKVSEEINSNKASKDKDFLQKELTNSNSEIADLSNELKQFKQNTGFIDKEISTKLLSSANPYSKKVAYKLSQMPEIEQRGKELELKLEAAITKYSTLKEKFEWISLVESMSKNASNITILEYPKIKRPFEKSEPSLSKNIILSVVVSIIFSSILVFALEIIDPKLTYFAINTQNTFWLEKKYNASYLSNMYISLKQQLKTLNTNKLSVITFNLNSTEIEFYNDRLKPFLTSLTSHKNCNIDEATDLIELFNTIEASEAVLLIGKIGSSEKELFLKIEEIVEENKNLLAKVILC